MAYSKLHSSLVNSSLWNEPDHVRLLFITLLAMCDKDGCVYGSRGGIERLANLDPDRCEEQNPWQWLMSPDKDSSDKIRAPENEGRRIVEISGGFKLLNFSYYRSLRNDDDRAEQNRAAQERFRAKNKPPSATVSHGKPPKAHTEAEAEAGVSRRSTSSHPSPSSGEIEEVVAYYVSKLPGRRPGLKERACVAARLKEGFTVAELKEAIDGCLANPFVNDSGKVFDGLELIMRSSAKVNQYRTKPQSREVAYGQGVSESDQGRVVPYNPRG